MTKPCSGGPVNRGYHDAIPGLLSRLVDAGARDRRRKGGIERAAQPRSAEIACFHVKIVASGAQHREGEAAFNSPPSRRAGFGGAIHDENMGPSIAPLGQDRFVVAYLARRYLALVEDKHGRRPVIDQARSDRSLITEYMGPLSCKRGRRYGEGYECGNRREKARRALVGTVILTIKPVCTRSAGRRAP